MPEARPLEPGDPGRLGDYDIVGRLGLGGQGVVFLGRGPSGEPVAVKLLHAQLSDEPLARSRFIREVDVAKQVATFCTAAVLDADVAGDRPYIVSEYVEGPSLQGLVAAEGPRGRSALERLAIGTATALTAIHRAGVVHRDFKPGNVLLGNDGPRVIDFGIARALDATGVTATGGMVGTPAYMAPEQLSGVGVGPAADVFAWGSTLLFAASGHLPFGDDSVPAVMQRIMYDEPDLADLPDSLRDVVTEALSKEPGRRPTARQILDRLLGQGSPVAGMPAPLVAEARTLAAEGPPRPAVPLAGPIPSRRFSPPLPEETTAPFDALGPDPAEPDPVRPDPVRPDPVRPDPVRPDPGRPEPVRPDPGRPEPVRPDPGRPEPVRPDAGASSPTTVYSSYANPADQDRQATALQPLGDWGGGGGGGFDPPGAPSPAPAPPPSRRDNRPLGVLVSLAVGVLAGAAIIVLVLWPQLRGDGKDGGTTGTTRPAADNKPVSSVPESFAGKWKGTAINTQRNASFQIEVTFQAGQTTAQALYPARNCTCTLTLTRGTGSRLEMTLTPTAACAPKAVTPGDVVVTRKPDGTLEYAWAKAGTALSYRGVLTST